MNASSATDADEAMHYYQNIRAEILPALTRKYQHVLDIGGGEGCTSRMLLDQQLASRADLWEYHPTAVATARASGKFEDIHQVDLNAIESWPAGRSYDLILLLDVLEHLLDPWAVLKHIKDYLQPAGQIVISLPNVRDATVVAPLVLKGDWHYDENGVLDRTHFRFFTRRTMRQMIQDAGLHIEFETPIRSGPRRALNLASLGLLSELFAKQYVFRCRRKGGR